MTLTSPAMMRKIMLRQYRWNLEKRLAEALRRRGVLPEGIDYHWQLLPRALRPLRGLDRSLLVQWAWLAQHGWDTDGRCPCGDMDTLEHRLCFACPFVAWDGPKDEMVELVKIGWQLGVPHKKQLSLEVESLRKRVPVPEEEFGFEPGKVSGDGSAPGAG